MEFAVQEQRDGAMVRIQDIQSLTEFQRNTRAAITRLKKTGRAAVLTVNGQAAVVVQDARAYQHLLEKVEEAERLLDLRRGIGEYRAGRLRDADEVLDELEARHLPPEEVPAGG